MHEFACSVLQCSVSILNSGLEHVILVCIRDTCNTSAVWEPLETIINIIRKLCMRAIWTQKVEILKSLQALVQRNCTDLKEENFPSSCKLGVTPSELVSVLENAVRETVIWNKQLKFQTNGCEVVRNGTYRSLESRQELDDDIPTCLLSEEPLVSTPIADCSGCQSSTLEFEEVGGPLLVEHVILALAITSADSAVTNLVLSELCTGLVSDDSRGQRCWSLRFLMVASAVSSIAALIRTLNIWHGSDGNDDACNGGYQATLAWAEKLFLVLVRIPTNTHAVSQLSRESPYCEEACVGRVSTVSQRRMGYAIFVGASAVNHSCDPNAAFRYCFKQVEAHETSPLQLLREGLRIELRCISKEPLLAGQELCVSYGPLKGRMTLAQRRNALSSQYLFLCRCASCVAEQEEEEERGRRSGGEQARQREQVQWKILRDLQNKVSVLSDEYLQLQLHPEAFSLFEQRLHLLVQRVASFAAGLCRPNLCDSADVSPMEFRNETDLEDSQLRSWIRKLSSQQGRDPLMEAGRALLQCTPDPAMTSGQRHMWMESVNLTCMLLDMQAQHCARTGQMLRAALLVAASIRALQRRQGGRLSDDNLPLGREYVKLAQLALNCGQLQCARWAAGRASALLGPFLADQPDPDWIDLMEICRILTSL